ncbi:MAG: hypothetical protein JSR73_09395 [Proteobacteria bacterium]|nr:hypothetical protein [Pseudomonadota bacterium]
MADGRFLDVLFCDDVRQEIGNKLSLIGCYGPDLIVPQIPMVLARLCAQARGFTPIAMPFESVLLRLVRDDQPLAELTLDPSTLASTRANPHPTARWHGFSAVFSISPFPIEEACTIRVNAETESGLLIGTAIRVTVAPQTPSS